MIKRTTFQLNWLYRQQITVSLPAEAVGQILFEWFTVGKISTKVKR